MRKERCRLNKKRGEKTRPDQTKKKKRREERRLKRTK